MSTPLAPAKVAEIRDIFDYQLEARAKQSQEQQTKSSTKMNAAQLRAEKEAVLSRLVSSKDKLDMYFNKPPQTTARVASDQDQTVVEPAQVTATFLRPV